MRRRRTTTMVLVLAVLVLAGCRPGTTPGTPESIYQYGDTEYAVNLFFGDLGPFIVGCAHGVVDRESGHWPYAGWGRYYQGPWQEHPGFDGTIRDLAAQYGFPIASRHDPYLSTKAARIAFDAAGGSFRANWPGTTPPGCP